MEPLLAIFRAIGDPSRLRILLLVKGMELAVGELAQVLGQSQPRVSRHVGILCDAGLAERRREGEDEARAAGMTVARLETGIHQPEAIGLYRKLGYALREAFGDYPTDDPNSVFMEKRLA